MDKIRAQHLAASYKGKSLSGWTLGKLLGSGKSAIVLEAHRGSERAAAKIFDPELVERFGYEVQRERIARECSLVGQRHPHLVPILGGEADERTRRCHIIMGLAAGQPLSASLKSLPRENIPILLSQLASAAHFLESLSLCHRDIKPDNIMLSDDGRSVTLLDLGVLKPVGAKSITDIAGQREFVGTLRYSPPELLLRTEGDQLSDWRAVTFYQIGAVLYDLIERRPLFEEFSTPYALLTNAVQFETPQFEAKDVPPWLVLLARQCLTKSVEQRLAHVAWSHLTNPEPPTNTAASVAKVRLAARHASMGRTPPPPPKGSACTFRHAVWSQLDGSVRQTCIGSRVFPPLIVKLDKSTDATQIGRFAFEPGQSTPLKCPLTFVVSLSVEDSASQTIRVDIAACISPEAPAKGTPPQYYGLWRGVFDAELFKQSMEAFLYVGLDAATESSGSPLMGQTRWLDLSAATTGG